MKRGIAVVAVLAFASHALAETRTVLVLPLGGSADPGTRDKLTTSVQKLARVIDGKVQAGDTTFTETAAAVGCDPETPACAESVRSILGVDEVVYGTATEQEGRLVIVVRRKVADVPPKQITATLGAGDDPTRAEPALLPLFSASIESLPDVQGEPAPAPSPEPIAPAPEPAPASDPPPIAELPEPPARSHRDRNFGIAAIAGGGVLMLTGFALWSSKLGLQNQIDNHETDDLEDLEQLRALEDRAGSRALFGNLCVLGGLVLGGYGGYLLYRDREARRRSVVVTPAPAPGGAQISITGAW